MPELKDIYSTYSGRLEIIGMDFNDTEESWKSTVSRLQLPWIQVFQPDAGTVAATYDSWHNITSSLNTDEGLTVNAARASKPGMVSTELQLSSEIEKSVTCGCFPQSYGLYEVREKTGL